VSKLTKFQKDHPEIRPPKVQHIRAMKPEFFTHEGVSEMSINARYAELGLWTCCDWHGRFEWRPKTLKIRIMPFDNVDFEALMSEWVEHGFVEQYEVDGQTYGQVLNWEKHQAINRREKDSNVVCPAPPAHIPSTCLPVPARAMSAGVGVGSDTGSHIGSDSDNGQGKGHSFIPPQNERTNDSPSLSPEHAETRSDIEIVSDLFQRESGAPFKAGTSQKPQLMSLIREHGLDVISEAVERFAFQDGNDWAVAGCPAAIFLSQANNFIPDAKHQVELTKSRRVRQGVQAGV
jgi:hypothetical protein